MIIKRYSCNNCEHKEVCLYQEDMIKVWENIEQQYMDDSDIVIDHNRFLLPYVAFFGLECKNFKKD